MKHLLIIAFFPLLLAQTCPNKKPFIENQAEVISVDMRDTTEAAKETDTTALNVQNKEDSDSIEWEGESVRAFITFRISDESGNDLLDPASKSPKAINFSHISKYYMPKGKEDDLYYHTNFDVKKGITLWFPGEQNLPYHSISFGLNLQPMDEITTTIIDWGDGHRDVVKAKYGIHPASVILEKAWLNDQLIIDTPNRLWPPNGVYEIIR